MALQALCSIAAQTRQQSCTQQIVIQLGEAGSKDEFCMTLLLSAVTDTHPSLFLRISAGNSASDSLTSMHNISRAVQM